MMKLGYYVENDNQIVITYGLQNLGVNPHFVNIFNYLDASLNGLMV